MDQHVEVRELKMNQDLPPGLSGSQASTSSPGEVIGVATLILQDGRVSGLAITAATVAQVWPKLRNLEARGKFMQEGVITGRGARLPPGVT